jgi:GntR family transcriptional regulator
MDEGHERIDHGAALPAWRQAAAILRARILDGRIPPGRVIPSETQVGQELEIARGTVRKAVALLRAEGLVVTVAGRGSYVVSEDELRRLRPR